MIQDLLVTLVLIGYAFSVLMSFGTVLTWVERKQAAVMADRIGANRAYVRIPFTQVKLIWLGLFHGMADGLKMMLKEDFRPKSYDALGYALGPWVTFVPVLLVWLSCAAIATVGALVCFVGLFVAVPVASLLQVYAWRQLSGGQIAPLNPQPLPPQPPPQFSPPPQ